MRSKLSLPKLVNPELLLLATALTLEDHSACPSQPHERMAKKDKAPKATKAKSADEGEPAAALPSNWVCTECAQEHEGEDASATECIACGEIRPTSEPTVATEDADDKYRGFKVGVIHSIEDISDKLKACTIDIGTGNVTIVTNATNVEEGTHVIVATVGAVVGEDKLQKRSLGGRTSEGMLCDAPMLGWVGGGAGAAAVVPESFLAGDRPPERRPRTDGK